MLTITAVGSGAAEVTVRATDPGGLSAEQSFRVTVSEASQGLSVDLRIEPSQSDYDAFRVLADPTFFAGSYGLDVYIITGDDAATWKFTNAAPVTAGEGWWELTDGIHGPQPLDAVTRVKVVFDGGFGRPDHTLSCSIGERTAQRINAQCSVP